MTYVGLPPGAMTPYAGSTAPTGWLLCDGSAVSRTVYANLFSAIGTLHGAGDGSSTFNLPDSKGRVLVGQGPNATVSTVGANDGLAAANRRPHHQHTAHTHNVNDPGHRHDNTHTHGVNVTDPGHQHALTWSAGLGYNPYAGGGNIQETNDGGAPPGLAVNSSTTGISVSVSPSTQQSGTTTTGISISSATSGSGNVNDAIDTPAFLVCQYIIKY